MFFWSFLLGSSTLLLEGFLAVLAFSHITNDKCEEFPCEIQKLYNENFLNLPFIGQVCNFYPMLNVSAVPILTITLRNNLFQLFGLESKGTMSRMKKGLWSACLSIPVIIVAMIHLDAQMLIKYTGGITGCVILLLVPALFVQGARKFNAEDVFDRKNFNKSPFTHWAWPYIIYAFAIVCYSVIIYGLITGSGGGH
jgi:hypothetical protein